MVHEHKQLGRGIELAGRGVALFTDFTRLRLRSSTAFPSGMLELAYAPAGTSR